ncbi:MAG: ornithine cyclodeaminase family protein [Pseudomonadota bacterium]
MSAPAVILTRCDLVSLMARADYLAAVEEAFRADKEGRAGAPLPMHVDGEGGIFHAKGAFLKADRAFVAVKLNGNFPGNPARHDLPTIQGAVLLCDASNGALLAIMDSIEITLRRTAAASALAARHLAKKDAATLLVCGCGEQARVQVEALSDMRALRQAFAYDIDPARAKSFAREMQAALEVRVDAVEKITDVAPACDVIVTCTTASAPILHREDIRPGAFIAAVGADSPYKNEIAPDLMAASKVVVDVRAQCAEMGDLRVALAAGVLTMDDVHADLGEIVTGAAPGRCAPDDIIVFDSTGTALQDVASAVVAYDRACETGAGVRVDLGSARH